MLTDPFHPFGLFVYEISYRMVFSGRLYQNIGYLLINLQVLIWIFEGIFI